MPSIKTTKRLLPMIDALARLTMEERNLHKLMTQLKLMYLQSLLIIDYLTNIKPCGFKRAYWYHISTSLDFSTANAFKAQIAFLDASIGMDYWSRSFITWSGTSSIGSYTFQSTDYIALRFSDTSDYPAIDCTFSAAFATGRYLTSSTSNFAFGVQEGK